MNLIWVPVGICLLVLISVFVFFCGCAEQQSLDVLLVMLEFEDFFFLRAVLKNLVVNVCVQVSIAILPV